MDKIFNLKIDTKIKNITTVTGLKQFDNNCILNITLVQNSLPLNLTGCTVRLNFLRADKKVLLYMANIVNHEEGKIKIKLSPEVLEKIGFLKCDISVFDSNLMKITGTVFDMKVEKSIYSNDYYLNMKDFDIVQQMHIEEEKRINNEKERVQNENTRVQNEDKRIDDENTRIKNEGTRIASEKERVQNENIRKENETTREKTFSNLKEKTQSNINIQEEKIKEITRINLDVSDNEAKRIEAEYIREKNSNTSISKEEERQANENKRIEAEKERINKEKERIEAEKTRQANENKIVEAEQERVLSENDRKSNELNRDKSEEERDLKESIRIEEEEERQANEKKRIDSEENRENTFKLMKNTIDNFSICEEYSNKKEYKKFNRVFFNGSCYECIKDCFNIQPGDIQYWLCIASKGKDGNGSGDMLTSTYDKNKNGKVDISELAESVDWENIKNKPNLVTSINGQTGKISLTSREIRSSNNLSVQDEILSLNKKINNIFIECKRKTYSELKKMVSDKALKTGERYILTDYKTKYQQPATNIIKEVGGEELILTALNENSFELIVFSLKYPNDIVWYDFNDNICEDKKTTRNGFITRRYDHISQNNCPQDWRHMLWSRNGKEYLTFGEGCKCNYIGYVDCLHNNVFGNECKKNVLNNECYNNTFGNSCSNNTFYNLCYNNTFGNECYSNILGSECIENKFGNECYSNRFGSGCWENVLGNNCKYNDFANVCRKNIIGDHSFANTFRCDCISNKLGNECTSNSFGNNCIENTLGIKCRYNSFANVCSKNIFTDNLRASYIKSLYGKNMTNLSELYDKEHTTTIEESIKNKYIYWYIDISSNKMIIKEIP